MGSPFRALRNVGPLRLLPLRAVPPCVEIAPTAKPALS